MPPSPSIEPTDDASPIRPSGAELRRLEANLAALATVDPALAERLTWPAGDDHVRQGRAGLELRLHADWCALDSPDEIAEDCVRAALDAVSSTSGYTPRRALLFGCGGGGLVQAALAHPGLSEVLAWDRDPWLLRLVLSRWDLVEPLRRQRLRLLLGTDLVGRPTAGLAVVEHPLLGSVYARERAHLDEAAPRGTVALAAGGLFVDQLGQALARRGFAPWTLDLERLGEDELGHALRALAPRFLLSVNYRHGLARLSESTGLPVVVWEVDPASGAPRSEGVEAAGLQLFTHRAALVPAWRAAGFARVEHLPLAADPNVRHPAASPCEPLQVAFVGQSLVGNAERLGARFLAAHASWSGAAADEGRALLRDLHERQSETPGRFRIPALLDELAPGFRDAWLGRPEREDVAVLAGEGSASRERLGLVGATAPLGLDVWGDAGWAALEGSGARVHGAARHGDELTSIYGRAAVNLDVARLYQNDIVTMRVFDAACCGGAVLTPDSAALREVFAPDEEVAVYRDRDELVARARQLLDHPRERNALAARGREAVLERHTLEHRLDRMLAGL